MTGGSSTAPLRFLRGDCGRGYVDETIAIGGMALLLFFGLSPGTAGRTTRKAREAQRRPARTATTRRSVRVEPARAGEGGQGRGTERGVQAVPRGRDGAHGRRRGQDEDHETGGSRRGRDLPGVPRRDEGTRASTRASTRTGDGELPDVPLDSSDGRTARSLLAKKALELCGSCHSSAGGVVPEQAVRAPDRARRDGMLDVPRAARDDAGDSIRSRRDRAKSICVSCHADKQGPFVFRTGRGSGDCMTCHEAHGSNNRNS